MKALLILCSLLGVPAGAALASDSPWNGTWKLDPAKSHLTGDTFTYTKGPGKLLHFADGSTASYDFGTDGKEYKTWGNRSVIWTPTGKHGWDIVARADGKVLSRGHRELSADGKTLTIKYAGTNPDGSPFNGQDVYTRVSGTQGLVGTWRSTKASPGGPMSFVISSPSPGVLHYDIPEQKATTEGATDGTDHPVVGPSMPPGMTIGYKQLSPTKLSYVIKLDGKPDGYGEQTIASDGRSFTDVSWNPGKESEKVTAVYVKQ